MVIYNFFIRQGHSTFIVEVWAESEDKAIKEIKNRYPSSQGYRYMLM